MSDLPLAIQQIASSVRFVKGYRYLDRCGEAVIRLQDSLDEGWIPTELSPKSGNLVNHTLGMTLQFSSEAVSFVQTEFIDFNYFMDQACKTYDILRRLFEVKRINGPSLLVKFQKGFEDIAPAEAYLQKLNLFVPSRKLMQALVEPVNAVTWAVVSEQNSRWQNEVVLLRRRIEAKCVRQVRQPPFDDRMLQRARLLPKDQEKAMAAMMSLRRRMVSIPPVAAQISGEHAFETEVSTEWFDLLKFYKQAWEWQEQSVRALFK